MCTVLAHPLAERLGTPRPGVIGATQHLLGAATTALIAVPATAGPGSWAAVMLAVALVSVLIAAVAARRAASTTAATS